MISTEYRFSPRNKFVYEPQKDITAYEVSQIIPLLIEANRTAADASGEIPPNMNPKIEKLETHLKRHFKEIGTAN